MNLSPMKATASSKMTAKAKLTKNLPLGLELLHSCHGGRRFSYNWYKASVSSPAYLEWWGELPQAAVTNTQITSPGPDTDVPLLRWLPCLEKAP